MTDGEDNLCPRHHHEPTLRKLDFQNLKVISAVGRGAKGVVFLCKNEASNEHLALKVVSKALIYKKGNELNIDGSERKRISFEQQVLRRFNHPLLPRLRGVLETRRVIGYAINYCPGGNLHSLRKKQTEKMFSDDIIRFYAVELVLALEYLHSLGIVYRDLKPENVVIQEGGHIMLIDFDLSTKLNLIRPPSLSRNSSPISHSHKSENYQNRNRRLSRLHRWSWCNSDMSSYEAGSRSVSNNNSVTTWTGSNSVEKSNSFVGTEDYVSPEVVSGKGHDFGVDWWSLGIVLYEMLYGTTPFKGANRKETFYGILRKDPPLTGEKTPLRDLIGKLLEKDPRKRIQAEEIKRHDFFRGVQWDTILEIQRPPFIPETVFEDETKGYSEKEVELFVHGIFFGKTDEEENNKGDEKGNGEENVESNKRQWVEGLNQNSPTDQTENFSVF